MAVKGLDRLRRQLAALPDQVLKAASEALEEAVSDTTEAVRSLAPHGRTGALAKSVGYSRAGSEPSTGATQAIRPDVSGRQAVLGEAGVAFTIFAGDDTAYYARWVEFGTAASPAGTSKDKKGKTRTNKRAHAATRAEPFFYPTIRSRRTKMKSKVTRSTNKAVKAVAAVK